MSTAAGHLPASVIAEIAGGAVPARDAGEHLGGCSSCSALVAGSVEVNLAEVFCGILAEIDAPRVHLLERLLCAAGMPSWLARSTARSRSLRLSWLFCSAIVDALAVALALVHGAGRGFVVSPLLVVAPCVVAAAVGFSYGPSADPAYEIVLATPTSRVAALLARMAAVIAVNSALIAIAAAIRGGSAADFAWFPSMAAVSLLAAVVAARTRPVVGVGTGCALWLGAVLSVSELVPDPAAILWGPFAQVAYGCVAAVLLGVLVAWTIGERAFAVARTNPTRNGYLPWT